MHLVCTLTVLSKVVATPANEEKPQGNAENSAPLLRKSFEELPVSNSTPDTQQREKGDRVLRRARSKSTNDVKNRALNSSGGGGALSSRQSVVGTIDQFTVEHSQPRLDNLQLTGIQDLYTIYFEEEQHYNYIGLRGEEPYCVITIGKSCTPQCKALAEHTDMDGQVRCLFTNRDGIEEFSVSRWALHKSGASGTD